MLEIILLVLIAALVIIWGVRLGKWASRTVDKEQAEKRGQAESKGER